MPIARVTMKPRRSFPALFAIALLLVLPATRDAALAIGFLLPICLLLTCAGGLVNTRLAAVMAVLSLSVLIIGVLSNLHI